MSHPTPKAIGKWRITVDGPESHPRWTRISSPSGSVIFDEEEAHDLHYALSRIVVYLDADKK
jgi:hypothetical protein